jgi:hypothetical protein
MYTDVSLVTVWVGPHTVKSAGHRCVTHENMTTCNKYNEDVTRIKLSYFREHSTSFKKQSEFLKVRGHARKKRSLDQCRAGGDLDASVRGSGSLDKNARPAFFSPYNSPFRL